MKPIALLSALALATILPLAARADTFSISFNGGALGYSGSGIFSGTGSAGVYNLTTAVSGSVTDPFFGTSTIVGISSYAGADNQLTFPSATYFDLNGLSFTLANGVSINLFYDGSAEGALQSNLNGDIPELVTDSVARVTPEPESLVLLATAAPLAAADLLRRRRCCSPA